MKQKTILIGLMAYNLICLMIILPSCLCIEGKVCNICEIQYTLTMLNAILCPILNLVGIGFMLENYKEGSNGNNHY